MPTFVQFTAIRTNAAKIPAAEIRQELVWYTREYIDDIIGKATDYPPPPPSPPNKYVRTGRYGLYMQSRNESVPPGIQYSIHNPVQDQWGRYYAGYVGGSAQTWFHARDGWRKVKDLAKQDKFHRGVQAIIQGRSR